MASFNGNSLPYWRWSLELLITGGSSSDVGALLTEDGLSLTTEAGDVLILEDA